MNDLDLLDIRQAAALLRVSEASLRRWTNAGRLASFRVGGRRERRFHRADLVAFLEAHPAAARAGRAQNRPTGHVCGMYSSDLARSRQAAGFLADRRGDHDVCFLVMAPDVCDRVLALLERRRPALRAEIQAGRFVVSESALLATAQLEYWETQFATALSAGAQSLHVLGDVSGSAFAQRSTFEEILEYEAEFERTISPRFPVTTLCQYDARTLSGLETARLLRVHGDAFRSPVEHLVS